MNPRLGSASRIPLLILALLATWSSVIAEGVSTTKDGITLAAEASVTASGRAHITCTLTNQSPYTLASVHAHSACTCFQFKLLDAKGNRVPQEKNWANDHRQDEPNASDTSAIGLNEVFLAPSEKKEFQFNLADAYGERAAEGHTLEVKWINVYSGPETIINVGQRTDPDGRVVPAHNEKVHFPGLWTVSVSLPLPQREGTGEPLSFDDVTAGPAGVEIDLTAPEFRFRVESLKHIERPTDPHGLDEGALDGIKQTSAPSPNQPVHPVSTQSSASPNRWWWSLIASPVLLLAWLGLRLWQRRSIVGTNAS